MQIREAFQQIYVAESTEQFEGLLNNGYYWTSHSQLGFTGCKKKREGIK
jgi:hypothetical protein